MKVFSTRSFGRSIKDLYKKSSDGYTSCKTDICDELNRHNFESIRISNPPIVSTDTFSLHKIRLKNAKLRLSKSDGYRLMAVSDLREKTLNLLFVYPKRGSKGIDELTDEYIAELVEDFELERKTNSLIEIDTNKELIQIESDIESPSSNLDIEDNSL